MLYSYSVLWSTDQKYPLVSPVVREWGFTFTPYLIHISTEMKGRVLYKDTINCDSLHSYSVESSELTDGAVLKRQARSTRRKHHCSSTLFTTNPKKTSLYSLPSLHVERPVSNCMTPGAAFFVVKNFVNFWKSHLIYYLLFFIYSFIDPAR